MFLEVCENMLWGYLAGFGKKFLRKSKDLFKPLSDKFIILISGPISDIAGIPVGLITE